MSRGAWLGVFLGVIALGIALAVLTQLATGGSETTTTSAATTASASGQFDLPLALQSRTLALAQHHGDVVVGIAARPGGPVEVAAVRGEDPLGDVRITLDGRTVTSEPCGRGCSRITEPVLNGRTIALAVETGATPFTFTLPRRLPASGAKDFARARRTMAALRSYHFTERLSSGSGAILTRLDVQAPDRLRLRTDNGFRSVIIGGTRWDYLDGRWQRQSFPGLNVRDVLMWYRARTPRVVRRDANGATELAAFSLQPVPSWFRLIVEPSGRVSQARMTAPSHFMLHRYSEYDRAPEITPPK